MYLCGLMFLYCGGVVGGLLCLELAASGAFLLLGVCELESC